MDKTESISELRRDEEFMGIALDQASQALEENEFPVGAVVVVNNQVIGVGRRSKKGNNRLDHAEMVALREATQNLQKEDIKNIVLYATLEPCIMCCGTLLNCRISRVVYALEDPYGGALKLINSSILPVRHKKGDVSITKGILREQSKHLLTAFFAKTEDRYWKNHPENPLVKLCSSHVEHVVGGRS